MNIFSRKFGKNRIGSLDDLTSNTNHRKFCRCRECKRNRKKESKVACAFLFPMIIFMAMLSALF